MQKLEVVLVTGKETKGTYVYEEELSEGGKPPVLKTQYIPKWWSLLPGDSPAMLLRSHELRCLPRQNNLHPKRE